MRWIRVTLLQQVSVRTLLPHLFTPATEDGGLLDGPDLLEEQLADLNEQLFVLLKGATDAADKVIPLSLSLSRYPELDTN